MLVDFIEEVRDLVGGVFFQPFKCSEVLLDRQPSHELDCDDIVGLLESLLLVFLFGVVQLSVFFSREHGPVQSGQDEGVDRDEDEIDDIAELVRSEHHARIVLPGKTLSLQAAVALGVAEVLFSYVFVVIASLSVLVCAGRIVGLEPAALELVASACGTLDIGYTRL